MDLRVHAFPCLLASSGQYLFQSSVDDPFVSHGSAGDVAILQQSQEASCLAHRNDSVSCNLT